MGDVPTIKATMRAIDQRELIETLNQQVNSAFNSLVDFRPGIGIGRGFRCDKHFLNGFEISIKCGESSYCAPREDLNSPYDYLLFEVLVHDHNYNRVTSDFFEDVSNDQVKGLASREEILLAIFQIININ